MKTTKIAKEIIAQEEVKTQDDPNVSYEYKKGEEVSESYMGRRNYGRDDAFIVKRSPCYFIVRSDGKKIKRWPTEFRKWLKLKKENGQKVTINQNIDIAQFKITSGGSMKTKYVK